VSLFASVDAGFSWYPITGYSPSFFLLPFANFAAMLMSDVKTTAQSPYRYSGMWQAILSLKNGTERGIFSSLVRSFWTYQSLSFLHLYLLLKITWGVLHIPPPDFFETRQSPFRVVAELGLYNALYPLLVVRNRMSSTIGLAPENRSIWNLVKQIYRHEGAPGFFRGWTLYAASGLTGVSIAVILATLANSFAPGSSYLDLHSFRRSSQFITGVDNDDSDDPPDRVIS
jgi:hypothetical protein